MTLTWIGTEPIHLSASKPQFTVEITLPELSSTAIERPVGRVIAWRRSGYGWLAWRDQRVWLHVSDVRDEQGRYVPALQIGQSVEFDVIPAPKGLRAKHAKVVSIDILSRPEGNANDHTV